MNDKAVKNVIFIVMGILIIVILDLKFVELPELLAILLGFIGFAVIINSAFELVDIFKKDQRPLDHRAEYNKNISYEKNPTKKSISNFNEQERTDIEFYDKDDLDTKIDNLSNLANELFEENKQLKEELKKYKKN